MVRATMASLSIRQPQTARASQTTKLRKSQSASSSPSSSRCWTTTSRTSTTRVLQLVQQPYQVLTATTARRAYSYTRHHYQPSSQQPRCWCYIVLFALAYARSPLHTNTPLNLWSPLEQLIFHEYQSAAMTTCSSSPKLPSLQSSPSLLGDALPQSPSSSPDLSSRLSSLCCSFSGCAAIVVGGELSHSSMSWSRLGFKSSSLNRSEPIVELVETIYSYIRRRRSNHL